MFLLVNNYRDDKSLPYVVSSEKFQTHESAMNAAKSYVEDAMVNHYTENYSDNQLKIEETDHGMYIEGPDFLDWWTIITY